MRKGKLRASHKVSYDPKLSKPNEPYYAHDRQEKIPPGTVIDLEIPVWPTGMVFGTGESLIVRVAGRYLTLPEVLRPDMPLPDNHNRGKHFIYSSREYDSHILLPIIKGF